MADVTDYTALITSEYSNQPNFVATVIASIRGLVDAQNQLAFLLTGFDLDTAVGQQLDMVGQWIGLTRFIVEPVNTIYLSLDVPGAGLDQGQWAPPPPIIPPTAILALNDNDYRTLLKARVLANNWDGTKASAYAAWNALFNPRGFQVLIQEVQPKGLVFFSLDVFDAGLDQAQWFDPNLANNFVFDNMRLLLALVGPALDPLTSALFTGGYLDLKPAGVLLDYAVQTVPGVPIFGLDVGPPTGPATCPPYNLAGLDLGAWAEVISEE